MTLRSAENVLDILIVLQNYGPVGLNEISRSTKINKSTVFKILSTLKSRSFVEQDENEKYKLGIAILQLSGSVLRDLDLRNIARPYMKILSNESGNTVTLGVRSGNYLSFIDRVDGIENVRFYCDVGRVTPFNGGAAAKALLAFLEEEERTVIINSVKGSNFTAHTKDAVELKEDIADIKNRGYSISDEEVDPGVLAIGVPIFDHRNKAIAGMAIAGIKQNFTDEVYSRNRDLIIKYGNIISEKMGATLHL